MEEHFKDSKSILWTNANELCHQKCNSKVKGGTAGNYWGGSGILIIRSGRAPLKGDPPDWQGGTA